MDSSMYLWLIPFAPFCGFLLNGLAGRRVPRAVVSLIALAASFVSFAVVVNLALHFSSLALPHVEAMSTPWIAAGHFRAEFAFTVDQLTMIMLLVVTGVGFLIHLYSVGYMAHEEGFWRFFAYLNLFLFFMLVLVLSANYLLMFVGWEGVGLASYLLIGFYYNKTSAADAGKKAFVVNRIGDFGFLLAMFLMIAHFGTLSFSGINAALIAHPAIHGGFLTAIALCLVLGATGKSAQIPLYVWLPDAMEGPTPVSALIHAATMVTAGIYMVVRTHAIFDRSPLALGVVAVLGGATALLAATIGLVQTDIKRVLAYSTVSQLGYMFFGCGVAAYSAAIFHVVTHAFFKALLFLAAGSVIHALNGEQDMRVMGDLRKKIPITFWTMTAGVFAIAGFFPLAGFFSKDAILFAAFTSGGPGGILLWAIGAFTALLTSIYMFRLWYLTFFGEDRTQHAHAESPHSDHSHAHSPHESPWIMLGPLVVLAALSVVGGWLGWPEALGGSDWIAKFLAPVTSTGHELEAQPIDPALEVTMSAVALCIAALGLFIADTLYRRKPELPAKLAQRFSAVHTLLLNKYWVDELYHVTIVVPLLFFSRTILGQVVETGVVSGGALVITGSARGFGALLQRMQSGNIRSYAGWLAAGAAVVLLLVYFGHGGLQILR